MLPWCRGPIVAFKSLSVVLYHGHINSIQTMYIQKADDHPRMTSWLGANKYKSMSLPPLIRPWAHAARLHPLAVSQPAPSQPSSGSSTSLLRSRLPSLNDTNILKVSTPCLIERCSDNNTNILKVSSPLPYRTIVKHFEGFLTMSSIAKSS